MKLKLIGSKLAFVKSNAQTLSPTTSGDYGLSLAGGKPTWTTSTYLKCYFYDLSSLGVKVGDTLEIDTWYLTSRIAAGVYKEVIPLETDQVAQQGYALRYYAEGTETSGQYTHMKIQITVQNTDAMLVVCGNAVYGDTKVKKIL